MVPTPEGHRAWSADELTAAALAGEAPAWNELARRHSQRVLLALLARGVPLDAAEDIVQETWVHLLGQQRAGRLRTLQMPGLAIAQARWLARERSRTLMRREALIGGAGAEEALEEAVDLHPDSDPERRTFDARRLERVRRELELCPERAREVFKAAYAEHAPSHAEVARQFGLSVQRVRQIVCEVRARLRSAMGESGGEEWT